jgi:hypothetical protein
MKRIIGHKQSFFAREPALQNSMAAEQGISIGMARTMS